MKHPDPKELTPLLPRVRHQSRLKQVGILALPLAHFLRCHVAEVMALARKLGVLTIRYPHAGGKQRWITWQGAEKIILLVRARQGGEEIARIEARAHAIRPSGLRR